MRDYDNSIGHATAIYGHLYPCLFDIFNKEMRVSISERPLKSQGSQMGPPNFNQGHCKLWNRKKLFKRELPFPETGLLGQRRRKLL